jgi:hypothetical protein
MSIRERKDIFLFLQRKQKEWQMKSLKYYRRFQRNRKSEVIIKFVKSSSFALLEKWVTSVIVQWHLEGEHGLLQKVFLPQQGERAEKHMLIMRNLLITGRIDALVARGMNKTAAIECYCMENNLIVRHANIDVDHVRRIYYSTKKKKPENYVREDSDYFEMYIYPAKLTITENGRDYVFFGLWRHRLLKKDPALTSGELCKQTANP